MIIQFPIERVRPGEKPPRMRLSDTAVIITSLVKANPTSPLFVEIFCACSNHFTGDVFMGMKLPEELAQKFAQVREEIRATRQTPEWYVPKVTLYRNQYAHGPYVMLVYEGTCPRCQVLFSTDQTTGQAVKRWRKKYELCTLG